ncbi:hypothetical protein AB1Y20_013252 [Prymnesium parvum]|uniref:Mediator of RNA polymerase II transcription subunit 21 n=1 Tax=Prymnesium parvum TaxID=97485 RepID=A0AB34IMX4_PRYPA
MSEPLPGDLISQMQLKVNDLCRAYFTSIGRLQNEAAERADGEKAPDPASFALATSLATEVVQMHRDFGEMIDELERVHVPEEEQSRRLRELQEKHALVTARLREQTAQAEAIRSELRRDLNELLRGMRAAEKCDDRLDDNLS